MRPRDLKYSETHEWVRVERDDAVIGITDYAIKELSDLVHLELPEVGDTVEQDSPFGEIESVKAVSDLISPLTGEVVAVNENVLNNIDLLTTDAFEDGWLLRIRMDDPSELETLITSQEYDELVKSEEQDQDDDETDGDEDDEEEEDGDEEEDLDEDEEEEEDDDEEEEEDEEEEDDYEEDR